jgi:hypothetical protein
MAVVFPLQRAMLPQGRAMLPSIAPCCPKLRHLGSVAAVMARAKLLPLPSR